MGITQFIECDSRPERQAMLNSPIHNINLVPVSTPSNLVSTHTHLARLTQNETRHSLLTPSSFYIETGMIATNYFARMHRNPETIEVRENRDYMIAETNSDSQQQSRLGPP